MRITCQCRLTASLEYLATTAESILKRPSQRRLGAKSAPYRITGQPKFSAPPDPTCREMVTIKSRRPTCRQKVSTSFEVFRKNRPGRSEFPTHGDDRVEFAFGPTGFRIRSGIMQVARRHCGGDCKMRGRRGRRRPGRGRVGLDPRPAPVSLPDFRFHRTIYVAPWAR